MEDYFNECLKQKEKKNFFRKQKPDKSRKPYIPNRYRNKNFKNMNFKNINFRNINFKDIDFKKIDFKNFKL